MARPTRDAIEAYMSITGAIEPVALQRLEEHGGDLAEAVNAHFGVFENNITSPTPGASNGYDFVEDNRQHRDRDSRRGGTSLVSAARGFMPSFLLDPGYRKNILRQIGGSFFTGRSSPGSHTEEVTGSHVDDYARSSSSHGSQIRGDTNGDHGSYLYDDNAEEEMIRAAIEASKKDSQDPSKILYPEEVSQLEEEELARALSLSLKTDELENAMREQIAEVQRYHVEGHDLCTSDTSENGRSKPGSSSVQCRPEDVRQKQKTDNRSGQDRHLRHIEVSPNPKELGVIPSEELDKALMLETELLSGMANNSSQNHLQGRHSKGHSSKNMELERSSALKESLLPAEPSLENDDAINLLVRMPDSSRHGRRFLKSDKLKHLFYFIDSCRAVETGTYKVVRPYPRHAFSREDGALTFEELGLTNKQEALFLELI